MRIIRSVHHKSCADGSLMKEYVLDAPVTAEFFAYLENFGEVEVLQNIGEGFYRFDKAGWFSIKGLSGDTTVEVRFKKDVMDLTVDFVYLLFSAYREEAADLTLTRQREEAIERRVRERLCGS